MEIQEALGADIMMAFDQCVALPAEKEACGMRSDGPPSGPQRCQASRRRRDQALFGIVQGGLDADLRVTSARDLSGWLRWLRGRWAFRRESRRQRCMPCWT